MGMMDKIKQMVTLPPEDDYEEFDEVTEEENSGEVYSSKKNNSEAPKKSVDFFGRGKQETGTKEPSVQVVLVKPSRFEDCTSIADHLNEKKTVVLNLENANREISRRLIDFLSGAAYSQGGSIKKVAHSTYIITPYNVNVLGDLVLDDVENAMYLG